MKKDEGWSNRFGYTDEAMERKIKAMLPEGMEARFYYPLDRKLKHGKVFLLKHGFMHEFEDWTVTRMLYWEYHTGRGQWDDYLESARKKIDYANRALDEMKAFADTIKGKTGDECKSAMMDKIESIAKERNDGKGTD